MELHVRCCKKITPKTVEAANLSRTVSTGVGKIFSSGGNSELFLGVTERIFPERGQQW